MREIKRKCLGSLLRLLVMLTIAILIKTSHIVIKLGANEREINREKKFINLVMREGARLADDQREL